MAFLALANQKALLRQQKNFYSFQEAKVTNQMQIASNAISAVEQEIERENSENKAINPNYEKKQAADDVRYKYYSRLEQQFEAEQQKLETQVQLLDTLIGGLNSLVTSNMKTDCTLTLSGGQ